jgi:hypothetical protein
MPNTSLLTNIIFIYYTFIISTLNIENFKKKRRNEPKIKSKLQRSDKGSYYNYLLLEILSIFCSFFYITISLINWFLKNSLQVQLICLGVESLSDRLTFLNFVYFDFIVNCNLMIYNINLFLRNVHVIKCNKFI